MAARLRTISISDVRFFAFHGYYPEEQLTGTDFCVDIAVTIAIGKASNDELSATLDYERLHAIATRRMGVARKLLETVADEMLNDILELCPSAVEVRVGIRKLRPPMRGEVGNAGVSVTYAAE